VNGSYQPKKELLTLNVYLDGENTIGMYLLEPLTNTVKCFCIDIDVKKSATQSIEELLPSLQQQTLQICSVFDKHGVSPLYLEFSGRKGYHIWGILDEAISAKRLRATLLE